MQFIYDSISTIDGHDFDDTDDVTYFRDDKLPPRKSEFSGSIVITDTEPFRHGVDIRSERSYSAGLVRFHAGEKGHRIRTLVIGQDEDTNFLTDYSRSYKELETYDPIKSISLNPVDVPEFITYVSSDAQCTYEHGQLKNVIEPLSIRPAASLMSTYYPHEAHTVWGNMAGGNVYRDRSSDLTANHYDTSFISTHTPYFDSLEIKDITSINLSGEFLRGSALLAPFIDEKLGEKLTDNLSGSIKDFSLGLSYNDNEIVRNDQKSSINGYQYDGAYRGTDSLAFGGLTY
jgi:hypothetical protein